MILKSSVKLVRGGALALAALSLVLLAAGRTTIAQGPGSPGAVAAARAFLERNASALGTAAGAGDLKVESVQTSLTGQHVRYQQTANGVPVFGAQVTVSLPSGAEPVVLSRYLPDLRPPAPQVSVGQADAASAAYASLGDGTASGVDVGGLIYYPLAKDDIRLAWRVVAKTKSPPGEWLTLVDAASGEVLYRSDLLTMDDGRVFDPNPGVSHGGVAAAPDCDSAANQAKLAADYETKTLLGIEPGQGKLKGEYADLTAPGIDDGYKPAGQADSPAHEYDYACNDDRFEEVMAYYHVDATQRKLQSLGFTGQSAVVGYAIPIHAHYFADCNAFFDPLDGGLHFGDSADPLNCGPLKTDTAEDADVIVHEYGHALQNALVPGWGMGPFPEAEQARSMGEGWGDFVAAVMSGNPCEGEYVNFGEYECGGKPGLRWLQVDGVYPDDFEACPDVDMDGDSVPESEEEHCGGQVWGAALWDLVEALGGGTATRDAMDTAFQLAVEAHFYMDPLSTFNEAAASICMVDNLLNNGENAGAIASAFAGRGISTGSCLSDDYEYFYITVRHEWSGDLDVNLLVGPDPAAPLCTIDIGDPMPFVFIPDWYIGTEVIDDWTCGDFMPPSPAQPWRLEVRDDAADFTGTIDEFEVMLRGGYRCAAPGLPVAIPDNGPAVYAEVDCSVMTGPSGPTPILPTPTPEPLAPGDIDCSGSVNTVDSLMILRHVAGMDVTQNQPCPEIGVSSVDVPVFGDVDCDTDIDSVDSLLVLRYTAGLPADIPAGCPPIGPTPHPTPTPPPTVPPTPTPVTTPTPVPTPVPAKVTLRNASWHYDSSGNVVVAGEVVNESDRPVGLVRVEASVYSASGGLLKTGAGYSCLMTVPGGTDSPYEILLFAPAGAIDHIDLIVAKFFDPPFVPAPEGLQGEITSIYLDFIEYLHAAGTVKNTSGNSYKLTKACVAFYNASGAVVRSKFTFTSPNVLGPGETASFDTSVKQEGLGITGERVWVDAMAQ